MAGEAGDVDFEGAKKSVTGAVLGRHFAGGFEEDVGRGLDGREGAQLWMRALVASDAGFARKLEVEFGRMWRGWCGGQSSDGA